MKFISDKIRDQDMFGLSVGFNYSTEKENFTSICSGFLSIGIKILLAIILWLRFAAIVNEDDNLYYVFENQIDPEVINEVKLENEGILFYFQYSSSKNFKEISNLDLGYIG